MYGPNVLHAKETKQLFNMQPRHDLTNVRLQHSTAHPKSPPKVGARQSMKWIELKRSSPVQIHESLILIQSNPADDPEAESSPVQSGHNRVDIYQIPCKIYM